MWKYFALLLIGLASALSFLYFRVGVPKIYREPALATTPLHFYDNPQKPISRINVTAVYFVPSDKQTEQIDNWRELLEENLSKLQKFHELQFQGYSRLTYKIYEQPIIGEKESIFYDTDNTNKGNPEALRTTAAEIEKRLLSAGGDLWNDKFSSQLPEADYQPLIILYEGVGASGAVGEPAVLISRRYFTELEYQQENTTTLAHEFYHTLGIPDGYQEKIQEGYGLQIEKLTTSDIMGLGRQGPLERTYLGRQTLQRFGLE